MILSLTRFGIGAGALEKGWAAYRKQNGPVKLAGAFGVSGEQVTTPDQIQPAMKRAVRATQDGRPYLIDALVGRTGRGAELTSYPKLSVAAMRSRKV